MGNYEQHLDNKTISGNSSTKFTTPAVKKENIAIQLVGDAESTNIDINVQGKTAPQAPFGENGFSDVSGKDLTSLPNNSEQYEFATKGTNTIQIEIVNNATDATDISAYEGYQTP